MIEESDSLFKSFIKMIVSLIVIIVGLYLMFGLDSLFLNILGVLISVIGLFIGAGKGAGNGGDDGEYDGGD